VESFFLSKSRFEGFSDAVLAIAATLLVLGFHLPTSIATQSEAEQTRALIGIWPQYLVYFTSFATIGIMWLNHHAQFRYIQKITYGMAIANLFLLLLICFLPFPTEVLASFGITRPAAVYYGLTLCGIAIGYAVLHIQLLAAHPHLPQKIDPWTFLGAILYPVSTAIAYFSPIGGIIAYVLIALYYMLPQNVARSPLKP